MSNGITKIDMTPERLIITHESGRKVRVSSNGSCAILSPNSKAPVAGVNHHIPRDSFMIEASLLLADVAAGGAAKLARVLNAWLTRGEL